MDEHGLHYTEQTAAEVREERNAAAVAAIVADNPGGYNKSQLAKVAMARLDLGKNEAETAVKTAETRRLVHGRKEGRNHVLYPGAEPREGVHPLA
jgi:hypothetical protein